MPRPHRFGATIAAGLLVLGLTACGDDDSDGAEDVTDVIENGSDDGADGPDDSPSAGDEPDVEDAIGSVEIPDDIPLPEEREIIQAIGNEDAGYTIVLTTSLSVDDAVAFYEAELPGAGWESVEQRSMGGDTVMVEANRSTDDHAFAAQISSDDGGDSSIQIFTGPPGG